MTGAYCDQNRDRERRGLERIAVLEPMAQTCRTAAGRVPRRGNAQRFWNLQSVRQCGVVVCTEEVKRQIGLLADDPAVVWHRSDVQQVAGAQLVDLTVLELRGGDAGQHQAHVLHGAAGQTERRADVRRPSLAGLVGGASDGHAPDRPGERLLSP